MRALVTGATGCVGANIVEALSVAGHRVRALQRSTSSLEALEGLDPELVVGDVLDYDSLHAALAGCDWVFHAAAVSQYWRNETDLIYRVNVEGTRNVLQAALAQGVRRVVYTSSVAALGVPERPGELLNERHPFNLPPKKFPYGHSKVLAEQAVGEAVTLGLDAVIVNPVTVIGQRDVGFIGGEFLRAAQDGKAKVAPPGGVGVASARRVGVGHLLAAERGRCGERYILNGENVAYPELMTIVAEVLGVSPPWFTLPRSLMGVFAAGVEIVNRFRRRTPLVDATQVRLSTYALYYDESKATETLSFDGGTVRAAVREARDWYRARGML